MPETPETPEITAPRQVHLAAALLLAVFALLCAHGLRWDTPTVDEFAHLPAGYHYLKTGRFDLFPLNPPLVKVLCALPLLALQPDLDMAATVQNTGWYPWVYGTDFMERNRASYDRIFFFGRLPVVALGMLLCLIVFLWARELHGDEAGLVALLFAVFCPSLIAHAHLATVDVGFAAFAVLALYLFHRFVHHPSAWRLIACGFVLGLAELSKHTALFLYPLFLILAIAALLHHETRKIASSLAAVAAIFLLSLLVLDAGYLFQGVGKTAGSSHFDSRAMRSVVSILPAGTPLPLPSAYLQGLDSLQLINEKGEFPEYLFGRWSREGSKAYYLVTLIFKTPLPLLLAFLLAPFARGGRLRDVRDGRGEIFLWLPALALFLYFSLFTRVHYGIRYILPVLPLAIIWSARLVPWIRQNRRPVQIAALVLLLIYPVSVLAVTPDTISYFNVLAGRQPDRILLDSNLDWGQGLKRVRAQMDREGIKTIGLAYFGHVDPAIYGIDWHFPHPGAPGTVAISANFLHGYPYVTYAQGRMMPIPPGTFAWVQEQPRAEDLGGGILIYRIGDWPPIPR